MGSVISKVTACTQDCPDGCSLLITADAQGNVRIKGNPSHRVTSGFTCRKIRDFIRRLRSPNRITRPLLRRGKDWQPVSWDEALSLCASKIQQYREEPASILHIHGESVKGALKQSSKLFFAQLGASRVRGSLCDAAGFVAYVADFGSRKNHDISDLLNAGRIVNWGKDLSRSSIHTAALVRKARQRGARVLTISPGGDGNKPFSDEWVRVSPGSDRFLAAAVLHMLIDEGRVTQDILLHTANWAAFQAILQSYPLEQLAALCGVTFADIRRVYSWYTGEWPTATIVGAGLQRHAFGGENVRFINALALLSGNIGRSGAGSYFHLHSLRNLNLDWTKDPEQKPRRSLLMPTIGRNILEAKHPPVRMIWINGSNVINQAPGIHETLRAFESIDFKVVVDAFMTDTGERAHLFLPCSLMFEQEDIGVSYLHDFVHHAPKVFSAPGEARSDHWILSELGKRLEPPIRLPGPEACLRASLNLPRLSISLEELREKHFVEAEHPPVAYAGMQFDHPDGKYHLPTQLHEEPPPPAGYPLRLLTLIRRESIHSQILPEDQTATPTVWVAPDCLCLGRPGPVKDVYLVSPLGRLKVRVEVSPGLHPGVAICRRGDWMKLGGGVNQLIAAGLTDIGNGAPYYQQYVSLEYATDQQLEELFDSMANSPQSVQAEIGSFCEGCAHRLDELNSDEARVELISEELPKLLLNKDLMAGLLSNITNGEAYPDVRRPTMFDNEVLLYLDPRGLFSLRIYLWGPMEYTYPHDHNSWGVIGAASEGYEVVNYRRVDDESHEGYARLVEVERLRLQPGETAFTLPFSKGIHKTGNATQASIATLHFYGKTLPRGHLNGFDIANNRVYRIYPPKQKKRLLAQQALECLGKAL